MNRCAARSTFVLLTVLDLFILAAAVRWMSIASVAVVDHIKQEEACDNLEGLAKRQKQICRRNLEMMEPVRIGAIEAIGECQYQFRSRRWNCSTIDPVSVFGKIINTATRETAFVHAISAAGVAHAVTRACSSGRLDRCGCDRSIEGPARPASAAVGSASSSVTTLTPPPSSGQMETAVDGVEGGGSGAKPVNKNFQWAGCSDNVAYGSAFSKSFVDSRETRAKGMNGARTLMNLHNNNAGRKAIEDYIRVQCKCHGVSGSCELKTCWRSMPSFREVGNLLRDRFDAAIEVEQRRSGSRRELIARSARIRQPTDSDLVYIGASPDFCEADQRTGSLGTRGRACNRTSDGTDGCELMCCGRGFDTSRRTVVERCHCKFHWCCYVRCQKCRVEIEEHICR